MDAWIYATLAMGIMSIGILGYLWKSKRLGQVQRSPSSMGAVSPIEFSQFNPLQDMTFDDFQNPEKFMTSMRINSAAWINGNIAMMGLQASALIELKGTMLAGFSPETAEKIANGAATLMASTSGNKLTAVSKSGRILEHANKIDPSKMAQLAQVAPFIIGAAHMVSSYDNAKKLAGIDEKLDRIVRYRKSDFAAELKTIFEEAKNSSGLTNELATQKARLRKLRNQVILEVLGELSAVVSYKNRSSISRKFKPKKTLKHIETALQPIAFLRSVVQLERIIYLMLGDNDEYLNTERTQTIYDLGKIELLIKEKLDGSKNRQEMNLVPLVTLSVEEKKVA